MIVWPATSGDAHQLWTVPDNRTMENALEEAVRMAVEGERERQAWDRETHPRGVDYEVNPAPAYTVQSPAPKWRRKG
jgi:hypothetical protein